MLPPPVPATAVAAVAAPIAFGTRDGTLRIPEAVAVAPDGTLLVGDHYGGRILRFRDGRQVATLGQRGNGACGELGAVGGVAAGADGRVYALDTDHQRVTVYEADGRVVRCWGRLGRGLGDIHTNSGSFAGSSASGGIAVDGKHVYVADTSNDRIDRFTLDGKNPKTIASGKVRQPQGVAVAGKRLLVADDLNHRVVEYTTSGRFVRATSSAAGAKPRVRLRFPYDVVVGRDGHTFVADNNAHRIVELDRELKQVRTFGSFGTGRGKLQFPRALALTKGGELLVADAANNRVVRYGPKGAWRGTIGLDGRAAGTVTAPRDVAVNRFGEVAVADGNARISWFSLAGSYLGAWAQGKSFQTSSAIVSSPGGLAFADDRTLRVLDDIQILLLGKGVARDTLPDQSGQRIPSFVPTDIDAAADGTTWVLQGRGTFAPLDANGVPGRIVGQEAPRGRSNLSIARLADGSIAIAQAPSEHYDDPADGTILRYDTSGRLLSTWKIAHPRGARASTPFGLAALPAGAAATSAGLPAGGLWVSDSANDRLLLLDATGTVVATTGTAGAEPGQLVGPEGLALACDGSLLVADTGNNRVQRIPGAGPETGCAPAGTPTPSLKPPSIVGLKVKIADHATKPRRVLMDVRATCVRKCTLKVTPAAGGFSGRRQTDYEVKATISGTRVRVTASATVVAKMRRDLKRPRAVAGVSVTVRAVAADGVVDRDAAQFNFKTG